MSFPNRGKGGGPPLGKNSHIFQFFWGGAPLSSFWDFLLGFPGFYVLRDAEPACPTLSLGFLSKIYKKAGLPPKELSPTISA